MKKLYVNPSLDIQNAHREDSDQTAANAQADLNLRWEHLSEGAFSDDVAHLYTILPRLRKICPHGHYSFCSLSVLRRDVVVSYEMPN